MVSESKAASTPNYALVTSETYSMSIKFKVKKVYKLETCERNVTNLFLAMDT